MKKISDELIAKYIQGECTDKEIPLVEKWIKLDIKNRESMEMAKKILERKEKMDFKPDTEKALKEVLNRLPDQKLAERKKIISWYGVAGIIIIITGMLYMTFRYAAIKKIEEISYAQLKYEKEKITLPDGSIIWMRKGSNIIYPERFKKAGRKIQFNGEGYFEVTGDKKNPFIIEADGTITRVKGTRFLLNTKISDSTIYIILEEGLVEFAPSDSQESGFKTLLPGQKLSYSKASKNIMVQKNQDMNYLSWKTKSYKFNKNSLDEIVLAIETLYDVRFGLIPDAINTERYQIEFDSTFSLEQIIENLEIITEASIDKMGDIYYFKPNS